MITSNFPINTPNLSHSCIKAQTKDLLKCYSYAYIFERYLKSYEVEDFLAAFSYIVFKQTSSDFRFS